MEASRKQSLMRLLKKYRHIEIRNPNKLFTLKYNKVLSFDFSSTVGFFNKSGYIGGLVLDSIDKWEENKNKGLLIYVKQKAN